MHQYLKSTGAMQIGWSG